jgi:hypothetical protein
VGDTVGVEAAVGGRGLLLVCMVSGLEEGPKITSFDSIAARRVSERRFLRDADKTAEKAKEAALWSAASITALFFSFLNPPGACKEKWAFPRICG